MTLSPRARKIALTIHVVCSVGWLGAVAAFLVVAVAGLNAGTVDDARGAYVAMDLVARAVILPACLASLVSGVVQSLGTPWGLFRHWWVIVKLSITVLSTLILLVHMQPIAFMASAVTDAAFTPEAHGDVRLQLVVDAAAAIGALLVTTSLSVVKPKGLTPYGWRKVREAAAVG